jgi:hypothetical protein
MRSFPRAFAAFLGLVAMTLAVACQRDAEKAPHPVATAADCAHSDMDGVCNTDDPCPDTKPGARVGPVRCDCDYTLKTHFANDSVELVATEDTAELDGSRE